MKSWTMKIALVAMLGIALLFVASSMQAQTVTPVAKLDLNKFTGVWYEIARLPWKPEKKCVSDAIVLFAQGQKEGKFQVVNSCKTSASIAQIHNAHGKRADKTGDGKLKVNYSFLFFIYQKEWVLAEAADKSWALIGSPNHKNLFLIARIATLPEAQVSDMKARAAAQGYAVDKLIFTPRSGR